MAYPDKIPMTPITIRVSQGSYEAIEDIARDNALSKAEVMRLAMNGQLQTHLRRIKFADEKQGKEIRALAVRLCDEISDIRMELNRIGVNYNQMARLRNAERKQGADLTPAVGSDLTWADLDAIMARFEKASEEVAELLPYSRVTRTMNGADALAYAWGSGYGHDGFKDRNRFVGAVNMLPEEVMPFKDQMQPYWDRADPRHTTQINRFIVSFHKSELDPDKEEDCYLALEIGREIAKANAPDCQSAVFVQTDGKGGKVHIHIVTNDVRMSDHKGLDHGAYYHPNFRKLVDRTCEQYFRLAGPEAELSPERVNAHVRGQRVQNERIAEANEIEIRRARREGREVDPDKLQEQKYIWQDDLRDRIKRAAAGAADENDFAHRLRLDGVEIVPKVAKDGTASYRHPATKKQPEYYLYELFDTSGFRGKIPENLRSKSFKLGANYQPDGVAKLFAAPAREEPERDTVAEPVREAGEVLDAARAGRPAAEEKPAQTDRDRDMAELKRTQQRAKEYVSTILKQSMPNANEDAVFDGFMRWRQRRRKEDKGSVKPVWKKDDNGKGVLLRSELNRQYLEYLDVMRRDKAERDRVRAVEEKMKRIAELDQEMEEIKMKAAGDRDVTDG